jgi:N-acylneuraminate cytidylyltransferase
MIDYPIKMALESNLFEKVIVSTDDPEIAAISTEAGAEVPWERSTSLSNDFATTFEVIHNVAIKIRESFPECKNICCIYPSTPLLNAEIVLSGLNKLIESNAKFVVGAKKSNALRSFSLDKEGNLKFIFSNLTNTRTQDLGPCFEDAGQFYWGTISAWLNEEGIYGDKTQLIELSKFQSVDLDDLDDLEMLKVIFEKTRRVVSGKNT